MTDFVPGSDFIPGSDLVPGVTDLLGIDTPGLSDILGIDSGTDWAPGIDQGGSGVDWWNGTDWAPGIDQGGSGVDSSWTNSAKALLNSKVPGVSNAASKLLKSGAAPNTSGTANAGSDPISTIPKTTPDLTPGLTGTGGNSQPLYDFSPNFNLPAMSNTTTAAPQIKFAEGGIAESENAEPEHQPEFYSEGGLQNRYVKGEGDGTSDSVPAMLANGEFVIPADVVSALGNGSNDSGANVLDGFLETIRAHKQDHKPSELPPDSESPLTYLSQAKNKVKS